MAIVNSKVVVPKLSCLLAKESGCSRFAGHRPAKCSLSDEEWYHGRLRDWQ